jgi:hypothetical protein
MKNDTFEDRWNATWSEEIWRNEIQNYTDKSNNPFISFPIVRLVMARTLSGDYWSKSKKQQQKENRINKLRQLQGEEPDEYSPGLVSVQPMSAPIGKFYYADYNYETEEEKRKKKQKERKEKLKNLDGWIY